MRTLKILIVAAFLMLSLSFELDAQLKTQVERKMSVEERIKLPDYGPLSGLLSSDRFFMRQSYSLSFFSMGNFSGSVGMYINQMSFLISDKLLLNATLGFVHSPLTRGIDHNSNLLNNLIYGAELLYKPTRNTFINLRFDITPYYYPSYYMYVPSYILR